MELGSTSPPMLGIWKIDFGNGQVTENSFLLKIHKDLDSRISQSSLSNSNRQFG